MTAVPKNEIDPSTGLSKCFYTVTTQLYVSLAPQYFSDPINGVKQQHLEPLLMTYFAQVKGVVLSYNKIKFLKENYAKNDETGEPVLVGKVKYDTPFVFMWVSVEFLVWRPAVGDIMSGYCYSQTPSFIALLVHDAFNATIKKYNIPSDWEFVPNADDENEKTGEGEYKSLGYWVDGNGVKVDGELKFTVKAVHKAKKLVSIEGSLLGSDEQGQGSAPSLAISSGFKTDTVVPVFGGTIGSHKKFDDDEIYHNTSTTEIPDSVKEDVPMYEKSDSDGEVVPEADSSEESEDSD